jgi:hypothetical protein
MRWWESLLSKRRSKGVDMASLKEVEKVADDLEQLVGDMRSELTNGTDFEKLTQIADEISERADNAAQTFSTVNETLMSRISDLTDKSGSRSRSSSGSKSKSSS